VAVGLAVGGRTVVRQDGGARVARRTGRCMEASTWRKKPLSTGSHVRKMKTSTGRTEEEAESRAEEEEVVGLHAPPVRPQVLPPVLSGPGGIAYIGGPCFFPRLSHFLLNNNLNNISIYLNYKNVTILPFL
jgi:hypothetical protein